MHREGTNVPLVRKGDTLSASTHIQASAKDVYAVVSDVTRIPEWSPETYRAEWLTRNRFRAWNRRRLGWWKTDANVVTAEPDREFSFIVQVEALGGDWAQWTYLIEPGSTEGTVRLTETFRMCVSLPIGAIIFEYVCLFMRDRPSDLQANLQTSVDKIRAIIESAVTARDAR
jgi:Polyketide cyclase / dehydrase and lipid transport